MFNTDKGRGPHKHNEINKSSENNKSTSKRNKNNKCLQRRREGGPTNTMKITILAKIASLRTEKKRDDAAWRSCCACVFPRLLASWQRRGGQFDLCDRVATCRHYDEYGWESLFKKVRFWVQTASFLFHMGFRRFLQINFLYIHGWLANETSKQLCCGCISPWEQHQERATLFPSSLLPI